MINERYQVIRLIGEGGMANVYLAHDIILDRLVAVKVLRGDLADDEKFVRRFQREAIASSSLDHPNIVGMYDVGEDNGNYFIVMEYIDGRTLKSLIKKRGALTLAEVMDIMQQLLDGVKCAHDSMIIHRDLKPQNIMILDDGTIKITDFGIATALNSNELTQTNSVMGSVHYLPPEQANGKNSTIQSDIYSIGIMMYELLTGKLPFKGENAVEIAIKQMKDEIPSVCLFNPEIPQSIENVILKACAKNPKNRYKNIDEMQRDLSTALDPVRKNEPRVIYKYDEQDLDDTKVFEESDKKELDKKPSDEMANDMVDEKKKSRGLNIALILAGVIFGLVALFIVCAIVIYPSLSAEKVIKIPDVSNISREDAVKKLEDAGFTIADSDKETTSEEIEEGNIVGTQPSIGESRKKGSKITLIISSGKAGYTVKDYTGKNYYEAKADLENHGIVVFSEKKDVSNVENHESMDPYVILEQSVKADTRLNKGDKIILYLPDLATEYPDFAGEKWTVDKVKEFCDANGVILNIEYVETDEYVKDTVITQTRPAKSKVVSGSSLKITVAKEKVAATTTTTTTTTAASTEDNKTE